jgi:hypothetical protein
MDIAEKLLVYSIADPLTDCRVWQKSHSHGYGDICLPNSGGRRAKAHRVAYELTKGPIPTGFEIDHLCRNTLCVNPDHLEAVTPRVNLMRSTAPASLNAKKTHCVHGHLFDAENTYFSRDFHGGTRRTCRACGRAKAARERAARKSPPAESPNPQAA